MPDRLFRYFQLHQLQAHHDVIERSRDACAILDRNVFRNARILGPAPAHMADLLPRGLFLCWRNAVPLSDTDAEEFFEIMNSLNFPEGREEEWHKKFVSIGDAIEATPDYRILRPRGFAGFVDRCVPHIEGRITFVGAISVYEDAHTRDAVTLVSWHPRLTRELVTAIFVTGIPMPSQE